MNGNKGCKQYKELVMEAIDGLISLEAGAALNNHVKNCPDCRKYLKNMDKIRKAVSVAYEPPALLETRIMANITGKSGQPVWQGFLRPALSFAASFGLVMIVSLFIIYKSLDNKAVTVADMPETLNKVSSIEYRVSNDKQVSSLESRVSNLTDAKVLETKDQQLETVTLETKDQQLETVALETKGQQLETVTLETDSYTEHGPSVQIAAKGPETANTAPKYDVVKTGEPSGLVMLKPGVIPTTTSNPLLDKDLATVANNLINPVLGQFATITIKVNEPANVKIIVYDKSVRPISRILDAYKDRGVYEATWEGRTDSGETVSDGVYFVYIQIGTRVIKKSIIVNK